MVDDSAGDSVTRKIEAFDALRAPLEPGVTLVEASAGTGKTFAITRLVLRLLLEKKVDELSQILVVTFTEKATQELVTRIRAVLRETASIWSESKPARTSRNEDLYRLCAEHEEYGPGIVRRAMGSLDDLGVSTIHGFCHRVLQESALETRIHFASTFIEDDTEPLQRAAYDWARKTLAPRSDAAELVVDSAEDPAKWVKDLVRPYQRHPRTRIEAGAELPATLLKDFVEQVHGAFEREKKRRHLMGFDDLLRRLQSVLEAEGHDGPLARRIRARFRVALIDEFQDTDPTQFPIFSTAFAGCPLFLIGDPKQSIYSFRNADVHAYLRAVEAADAHYTLPKNYRSTAELVTGVGALFGYRPRPFLYDEGKINLPTVVASGDIEVPPSLLEDRRRPLEWMWVGDEHNTSAKGISKEYGLELVTAKVTNEIVRLISDGVPGGNIAVLVRRNVEAQAFKKALDAAHVPAVVGSDGDILASDEGEELVRLAAAIADPRDAWAVRAAMATLLWGSDAADIAATLTSEGNAEWTDITDCFVEARDLWERSGVAAALTSLLTRQHAMPRLLALPGGERRLTNIRHLIELFQEASEEDGLAPGAFRAWVARERDVPNTPERRELRLESDSAAVQILTIHKAKGLEWPVVFCPTLWYVRPEFPGPLGVQMSITSQGDEAVLDLDSPEAEKRKGKEQDEGLAEALRVAYVALTRAESRCYVAWGNFIGAESSALGWLLQGRSTEIEKRALDALVSANASTMACRPINEYVASPLPARAVVPAEQLVARQFAMVAGQFTTWRASSFSSLTAGIYESDGRDVDDPIGVPVARARASDLDGFRGFPAGADAGTALHALFEHLDFPSVGALPEQQVADSLASYAMSPKPGDRWEVRDVRGMLETICTAVLPGTSASLVEVPMEATLREWRFALAVENCSVGAIADVLERCGSEHARAYAPRLRTLRDDAFRGYLNGVVDLAFEREGKWWIIDWKSNWLGAADADYASDAIAREMLDAHYILQYHIYLLALHRHLRARQLGYDASKHWGRVAYVFLRGVTGRDENGWYIDSPTKELLEALDQALGGTA
jgi:exodeoxyribonuclease V beta subunit